MELTVYKRCKLMNPREEESFADIVPVLGHGETNDPRSIVKIRLHGRITYRNIFDVLFLNRHGERVSNPWLSPGSSVSVVCECLGLDLDTEYDDGFLDRLASCGYPYRLEKFSRGLSPVL